MSERQDGDQSDESIGTGTDGLGIGRSHIDDADYRNLADTLPQLVLSVLVFGEHVEPQRIVMLALIWLALALYALDAFRTGRAARAP